MITKKIIWEHEHALYFKNGKFNKMLTSGVHYFVWFSGNKIISYDKRPLNLSLSAQEIISKDQISTKYTLQIKYIIKDAKKFHHSATDPNGNLYLNAQEILRKIIEDHDLEYIMENRKDISQKIEKPLTELLVKDGIEITSAYLKDIILPANLKSIFNKALENKKIAQVQLANTREQIANARALKNLADIYKDPILVKLLEIETAKQIGEKGGTVVFGRQN